MADVMCLAYQLAVRNRIKKKSFAREMKRMEGTDSKISCVVVKKFQLEPQKFFLLKIEVFHY